jgi:hypothetical protein
MIKSKKMVAEVLKTYSKPISAIIIIFAIGLVAYFIFAAPYGDGLEKTLETAGIEEHDPIYKAPLDYGDVYHITFIMGMLGFIITLCSLYILLKCMRRRK